MTDQPALERRPVLRVVRGNPDPAELAALLAVVLTRTEPPAERRPRPGWADHAGRLRAPLRPGPGSWRNSARR